MSNFKPLKIASLSVFLAAGGCQNYLERHDGVTTSAGDAHAINEAKLVVDPWNPNADNTDIHTDGKRASDAVDIYKNANNPENASSDNFGDDAKTTQ